MTYYQELEKRIRELPTEFRQNLYASVFWELFDNTEDIHFLEKVEREVEFQENLIK